jgi:hypothetical protein
MVRGDVLVGSSLKRMNTLRFRSRNLLIFSVESWDATVIGHALTGEDSSRSDALDYLSKEGYDVGSSGGSNPTVTNGDTSSVGIPVEERTIWPARGNPQTDAEELQQKAEQDNIENLTHQERIQVACRHLQYGWEPTWEWFKKQFGSSFKPKVTWQFLKGIVEDFNEYDHVHVPDQPT